VLLKLNFHELDCIKVICYLTNACFLMLLTLYVNKILCFFIKHKYHGMILHGCMLLVCPSLQLNIEKAIGKLSMHVDGD